MAIVRLGLTASTNDDARAAIAAGRVSEPTVWVARSQAAGKSRRGRAWESPEGGLWMTGAWPVEGDAGAVIEGLGVRAGAACTRAIAALVDGCAPVSLKWPNDVLIDGRKVCGILCEACAGPDGRTWLLVGVGVNVNNPPEELPTNLRRPATSLASVLGGALDLDDVMNALLDALDEVTRLERVPAAIRAALESSLHGIGSGVSLELPAGERISGILRGVAEDGRILLDVDGSRLVAPHGAELAS